MRRWLDANVNPNQLIGPSRRQVYRLAARNGLIDDVAAWWQHTESRNKTSHIYDEATANEVLDAIPQFLRDARNLLNAIEARK